MIRGIEDFMSDPLEDQSRRRHRYKPSTVEYSPKKAIIVKAKSTSKKIVPLNLDIDSPMP